MLYKVIAAALLVSSGEALKIGGGVSRRVALGKAAALAPLIAAPAFAELKRPEDAEIYRRADAGKLNAARAIQRAKIDDLVNGASATCAELDALIGTPSHSKACACATNCVAPFPSYFSQFSRCVFFVSFRCRVDREAVEYERDLIDATLTDAFVEDKDGVRDAERRASGPD